MSEHSVFLPGNGNPLVPTSVSSDDVSSVSTAASTISKNDGRPPTVAKPSGLKPPSKIGRLCSNSAPKPAVPLSPRTDGSSSEAPRKLSEDSSRKHLSDLLEAEEDEVSCSLPERPRSHRKTSTSSRSSVMSIEGLWEKHPRRLSEAGLRRSSDHSVVLTEDTDSFIIGERVWVGGTKPGQIAYIGETQFAPGDWAGIVLDDPIGKNDGSVAGFRYFQCPEKRGVFSRLTRLTREPLVTHTPHDASPSSDAGSVFDRPPSGSARPRRTVSPNGSVRSMVSSKMNVSISTTANGEVRLGDRVIVSSSRGSKAGTLRYVGVTEFASGVWAGVELDDPLGKNDGSVDGKRYFECSPRFGLFAPISKVSRSPSNRKPGTCAIHSNGRATPLRRSNSRDSLTSLGTSIASSRVGVRLGVTSLGSQRAGPRASSTPVSAKNALQELLREKQHHLERLMRERELERSEIAKVSLQASRAENALEQAKKEAAHATSENAKIKADLAKLNKMLEDERQKVEDLMFRNEEENINKEDYNKYREAMEEEKAAREKVIRELEAEVALQTARAETTAAALRVIEEQSNVEMASLVEQHKEELTAAQNLSSELQNLLDEAYALLKEKENEKDSLGKSLSEELTKVKSESEKALSEAKTKLAITQTELDTQVSMLMTKLQMAESKLEVEKQNAEMFNKENSQIIVDLNSKVTALQAALNDKTLELSKVTGSSKEHEVSLNKEVTKLKMELSAKVLDFEQLEDSKKKLESVHKTLQLELAGVKEEFSNKIMEYETFLNEASQQEEKNKSEIFKLQQEFNIKSKEYERLCNDTNKSAGISEKLINDYKQTIHERDKEIIKLKDDFEQTTANFNINHTKIAEEHKKEIDDRNCKIEQLLKEIEKGKEALDQNKIELDSLNSQFTMSNDELNLIKEENKHLKQALNEAKEANNVLKDKISQMELEIGELNRQLNSAIEKYDELQRAKEKIENECLNLSGQTTNSNEQYTKLSQHLKSTENELQNLKDRYRESSNTFGRTEQELKQRIFKIEENFAVERGELVQSIEEYAEKLNSAENKIKEFVNQSIEVGLRINELEKHCDSLIDENSILKKETESLKIKEQELSNEYDLARKKLEVDIDKYKEEISILKADGATSEVKLMEKVDQLTDAQNDLNNKLEEARKHEDSLQTLLDDVSSQLNIQKQLYEKDISALKLELNEVTNKSNRFEAEETLLKTSLEEKLNLNKDLLLKIEMLEVDVTSNLELLSEKDRQITDIRDELNKTLDAKSKLEENLNKALLESTSLKHSYENLMSNSSKEALLVQEQLDQIETVKLEMAALHVEKTDLETKYKEASEELHSIKNESNNVAKKLIESIDECNRLNKIINEKQNELKSESERNETLSIMNQKVQEDILTFKEEITKKDKILEELQLQVDNLNKTQTLGSNQSQDIINGLVNDNNNLNTKYLSEIESLNTDIKAFKIKLEEKENQVGELEQTKDKLNDVSLLLSKSEEDIKQLTIINEGQKSNYEDLIKQLQTQFEDYKKNIKSLKHEFKKQINDYEKELKDSREKIIQEQAIQTSLKNKLTETENKLLDLSQKLELLQVQVGEENKDERLEKLTLELHACRNNSFETLGNSEKMINSLRVDMEHKIKDLQLKEDMILKLQEELKNYKTKVEIAEREKVLIQKEISNKGNGIRDKNDNQSVGLLGEGDIASQVSEDDREMLDGKVSFLNSVIVDMQRKNEKLLARVRALEGATTETEQPLSNGRKVRVIAPRLFCDICDVFDAHDTDDCPRQAQLDAPATPSTRPKLPPRPYCDICEVFGHDTENCEEEMTF